MLYVLFLKPSAWRVLGAVFPFLDEGSYFFACEAAKIAFADYGITVPAQLYLGDPTAHHWQPTSVKLTLPYELFEYWYLVDSPSKQPAFPIGGAADRGGVYYVKSLGTPFPGQWHVDA